jgi:serine/threonine-protein kinase
LFPQIFGKYVLERPIAMGGMARVFLATLRGAGGFEKKLVVKQIRAELATDEAFVKRFVAEAKTTVELSHPNIVPVYELGVEQGVYYLAMELCAGVTLAELIQKTGKLTPEEGAYVGIEICRALDYAHRKARIIHRDVTLRNAIIDEEGAVRIIDFGIAAPAFSGAKEVFGSPGHMPPEQIAGGEVGPPTDVFAVAALLYETWTKVAPFRRATPEESERAMQEPVAPLSSLDPALAPLDELVETALALDPSKRPQSTEELSRPLRKFLASSDLGDLARRVGAKVAHLRSDSAAPPAPTDESAQPEVTPVADVTRTFATRPLEQERAPASSPADESPAPNISTRKMSEEEGSWSTGRRPAPTAPKSNSFRFGRSAVLMAGAAIFLLTALASSRVFRSNEAPASPATTSPTTSPSPTTTSNPSPTSIPAPTSIPTPTSIPISNPIPAPTPSPSATSPDDTAPAHFHIFANPQATVEIDGRSRGATPIGDLSLTPGSHLVRLTCAPLDEMVSQSVRVSAGESLTISGDFTGAKGRLLVRRVANP